MELQYEDILLKTKELVLKAGEKVKEAFESREIINSSIEEQSYMLLMSIGYLEDY